MDISQSECGVQPSRRCGLPLTGVARACGFLSSPTEYSVLFLAFQFPCPSHPSILSAAAVSPVHHWEEPDSTSPSLLLKKACHTFCLSVSPNQPSNLIFTAGPLFQTAPHGIRFLKLWLIA